MPRSRGSGSRWTVWARSQRRWRPIPPRRNGLRGSPLGCSGKARSSIGSSRPNPEPQGGFLVDLRPRWEDNYGYAPPTGEGGAMLKRTGFKLTELLNHELDIGILT